MSKLTDIADAERKKNQSKNLENSVAQYTSSPLEHKDSTDGSKVGNASDVITRKTNQSKNPFNSANEYNGGTV